MTLAAILDGAAQVFERYGYAAGTTDAIAERAGVSVGSVYQYFPNKDAILVALVGRHIDDGFALVEELLGAPSAIDLEATLHRFVDAMMAHHEQAPRLHSVFFEEAPLPIELRRSLEQRENALVEGVARLLTALPGMKLDDPDLSAYLVVRCVEGLVHSFVLHPPPEIAGDAFSDELVKLLKCYLE